MCYAVSAALTAALAPLFAYLGLITLATLRRRETPKSPAAPPPRLLVVIPAHDEQGGIGATVASCLAAEYPPDRLTVCVIADNCSDRTAAVARDAGAVVVVRHDPGRRGKGYALDYLFRLTPAEAALADYDAAVVVDADSALDAGALAAFAAALAQGGQWLQGYSTVGNPGDSRATRLLTYAFSLVNGVWLLGQQRLGMGVMLRGNGMCFATAALARVPWRAYGLTEDAEFSWVLRTRGERARFVPGAVVRSAMLTRFGPDAAAQRGRWEWGRRGLRRQFLAPLLRSPCLTPRLKALYLADLLFPPMVRLLLLWGAALTPHLGAALDARLVPVSRALLPAHALMAAALGLYAVSPVLLLGLPARYLLCLLDLPYYAAWKVAVALGGKPAGWTRTRRVPWELTPGLAAVVPRPDLQGG
jgi:cellulose synthase/poly-beta-1,6-N-acetylglucosamine synthase-like glycosyltransferase